MKPGLNVYVFKYEGFQNAILTVQLSCRVAAANVLHAFHAGELAFGAK